ncbi:MAG TPA: hypothetical protein PKY63_01545 [Bacteroidales bacterium]|nr:hypothetical protein [Bacteroidales bacterium]
MNLRIAYRIYRLRARILRNMLAMLSFSALISSCNGVSEKQTAINKDSLKLVELNQQLDSVLNENETLKLRLDSIIEKEKQDSIADAKKQVSVYVAPVIPDDPGPICEYGVPPVYEFEISPEQIQTKYGVPRN